jgi:hypothetical protein
MLGIKGLEQQEFFSIMAIYMHLITGHNASDEMVCSKQGSKLPVTHFPGVTKSYLG